jgi:catechol 2,3-dioxygenase-like lactoylglutathione lyase family enzyme
MALEFDHVALSTKDITRDIAFYRENFPSLEVLYEDETWAFLKIGDFKLALVTPGEHPPHVAFRAASREEFEHLAAEADRNIMVHRDKSESFYIKDPSGNPVEIVWYP